MSDLLFYLGVVLFFAVGVAALVWHFNAEREFKEEAHLFCRWPDCDCEPYQCELVTSERDHVDAY